MALWNRPFADGIASSVLTLPPPPDWPKIVTLPGSPPKRAMLSRTHCSDATMSSMPTLPESANSAPPAPPRYRCPTMFEPMVDADDDDVAGPRQVRAVVAERRSGAVGVAAAVDPHHHGTLAVVVDAGREDVQHQAILALRRVAAQSPADRAGRRRHLRRRMAVLKRVAHAGPRLRPCEAA